MHIKIEKNQIKGRIFIVGCPRSGTTLLQSLVSAHSQIASFPETNFFNMISDWRSIIGLSSITNRERNRLINFLYDINRMDLSHLIPDRSILYKGYIHAFVEILDTLAKEEGAYYWLEKTPAHLYRVDLIEQTIDNPKFIHLVRKGEDVVASLFEVTHKYPDVWWGAYDIDKCVERWNKDISITYQFIHRDNHYQVNYEQLIKYPNDVLSQLFGLLEIPYEAEILQDYRNQRNNIILDGEHWKTNITESIRPLNNRKFNQLFSPLERDYIRKKLIQLPISPPPEI